MKVKSKDFKFTEEYIQDKLNGFFSMSTQKYILENLYVFDWESDKFIETRSGLIYEFEIKVTKSDFKADFKKKDKHAILEGKDEFVPSYDEMSDVYKKRNDEHFKVANKKKPNYFYYAVPEGMLSVDEIPEYAGLIYVLPENVEKDKNGNYCLDGFYVVKSAPKLHNTKYTDQELNLVEKFYWNMRVWKDKCQQENKKRLITESHKIPYAELMEKYEASKKECNAMKALVDSEARTNKFFAETMEADRKIICGYQKKMKELDPNFDHIKFEDQFFDDEE